MRDRNLDIYRGAIMIYITCFLSFDMVGRCQGRHILKEAGLPGYSLQWQPVLYSRSLIFPCHWKKPFRTYLKGRIKKSRDPLLEVCIGLFSGCCVSLLEVGRDNTVE